MTLKFPFLLWPGIFFRLPFRVHRFRLITFKFRDRYDLYGDKAEGLWTDSNGWADFLADGGTASIWIEDGAGLDG